ncbi:MAG: dihydroorotate dehydrogenase electron transfer subunit [Planctomycetes bacterium]|nr:dihydroorotate dehydrogenase electron transfer subunit [Planctomycetota bacterium]
MACIESRVLGKRVLEPDAVVLTLESTGCAAPAPFQFCMLSVPDDGDFPFMPRPFSVYDAGERSMDFLIKVVGRGSARLADLELGDEVQLSGPLGRGVGELPAGARPIGAAGGVGSAPFLLYYRRLVGAAPRAGAPRPLFLLGARTREFLYDLELFQDLPVEVRVATEDGSCGKKGLVTDLLRAALEEGPAEVLACGPDPMLAAVARLSAARSARCLISLETHMACGYGVCNGCAVKVKDERYREGFRYDRCCTEGPVFDAADLVLDGAPAGA